MPQVKKEDVRNAILNAAFTLITEHGYVETSMSQIARAAGISNANIYIYFDSKVDVFFSIYEVWLKEKVRLLEQRVIEAQSPREKCVIFLDGLLREIPQMDKGFANNLIQAISTVDLNKPFNTQLVEWMEERINELLKISVPVLQRAHAKRQRFAHFFLMAFDGYTVNIRVRSATPDRKFIEDLTQMLLME